MTIIEKIHEFDRFGSVLGLERMTILMSYLGNPERDLKVIHVAGTNGKGSVCKYIYEALEENGYKVGLYISPFLETFNERIEFDRVYISEEDLTFCTELVLEQVKEMVADGHDSPTEFEVVTAAAFVFFAKKQPDYVVLEVGLGGSGDSTNIIDSPLITVITSISYDHMDRLGNTLHEIAGEKAGIIKRGVPVIAHVSYEGDEEGMKAAKVIARKAYEQHAVLYDVAKIKYSNLRKNIDGYCFDVNLYGTYYNDVEIGMIGEHQVKNAVTALATLEVLRKTEKIKVERSRLYAGMKRANQFGRFEIISAQGVGMPYIIIDGAHNAAGAEAMVKTLEEHLGKDSKILMVIGILAEKEVDVILDCFCKIMGADFIATEPVSARKIPAEILSQKLKNKGRNCIAIPDIERTCNNALERAAEYDAVVFAGSLYLIGKVRGVLKHEKDD